MNLKENFVILRVKGKIVDPTKSKLKFKSPLLSWNSKISNYYLLHWGVNVFRCPNRCIWLTEWGISRGDHVYRGYISKGLEPQTKAQDEFEYYIDRDTVVFSQGKEDGYEGKIAQLCGAKQYVNLETLNGFKKPDFSNEKNPTTSKLCKESHQKKSVYCPIREVEYYVTKLPEWLVDFHEYNEDELVVNELPI